MGNKSTHYNLLGLSDFVCGEFYFFYTQKNITSNISEKCNEVYPAKKYFKILLSSNQMEQENSDIEKLII